MATRPARPRRTSPAFSERPRTRWKVSSITSMKGRSLTITSPTSLLLVAQTLLPFLRLLTQPKRPQRPVPFLVPLEPPVPQQAVAEAVRPANPLPASPPPLQQTARQWALDLKHSRARHNRNR